MRYNTFMNTELALAVVVGLATGAVVALKVIAPLTKTAIDDRILAALEKVLAAKK